MSFNLFHREKTGKHFQDRKEVPDQACDEPCGIRQRVSPEESELKSELWSVLTEEIEVFAGQDQGLFSYSVRVPGSCGARGGRYPGRRWWMHSRWGVRERKKRSVGESWGAGVRPDIFNSRETALSSLMIEGLGGYPVGRYCLRFRTIDPHNRKEFAVIVGEMSGHLSFHKTLGMVWRIRIPLMERGFPIAMPAGKALRHRPPGGCLRRLCRSRQQGQR